MNEKLDFNTLSPKQQTAVRRLVALAPGTKLTANKITFAVTTGQSLVRKGWAYHEYGQGFGNARAFYSLTPAGYAAYSKHLANQSPSVVLPSITADAPVLDHPALTELDNHIAEKDAYAAYRTAPEVGDNAYMTFQEWRKDRQRLAADVKEVRSGEFERGYKTGFTDGRKAREEINRENADLRTQLEAARKRERELLEFLKEFDKSAERIIARDDVTLTDVLGWIAVRSDSIRVAIVKGKGE